MSDQHPLQMMNCQQTLEYDIPCTDKLSGRRPMRGLLLIALLIASTLCFSVKPIDLFLRIRLRYNDA